MRSISLKKIGILGGTFNPPHLGHLMIGNIVQSELKLDEIWFMPNQEPPHKENESGVDSFHRLEMVKRAIAEHPRFKVQPIELERPGKSYTFDTIKLLKEKYDHQFYFIIGGDMIEYLPKWYKIEELVKLVTFIGVNRPDYSSRTNYPILFVDVPNIEISSRMIRKRVKEGKSIRYFVPDSVLDFIEENRLYEA